MLCARACVRRGPSALGRRAGEPSGALDASVCPTTRGSADVLTTGRSAAKRAGRLLREREGTGVFHFVPRDEDEPPEHRFVGATLSAVRLAVRLTRV